MADKGGSADKAPTGRKPERASPPGISRRSRHPAGINSPSIICNRPTLDTFSNKKPFTFGQFPGMLSPVIATRLSRRYARAKTGGGGGFHMPSPPDSFTQATLFQPFLTFPPL